jgi:hypothetical protein
MFEMVEKTAVGFVIIEYVVVGSQMVVHGLFSELRDPVVADT